MTVHVFRNNPRIKDYVNTTSRSGNWSRGLSPFILGPVHLYDGMWADNVENAWQFSKVYREHVGKDGLPSYRYFRWAEDGWANPRAIRYPMGKGAKPMYSWWDSRRLSYIEARKHIYCPLYARAVEQTAAYRKLKRMHQEQDELWLWGFDAYDHRALGYSWADVLNDPVRKMDHAFVLAMMLEGDRAWEAES